MERPDFFQDPLELIFAEIAIRVQLPPSKYNLACDRYKSVADYLEREGSPLKGKIARLYPQGSMAIGATIAARGKDEEYDIDIVAELTIPETSNPEEALDLLYFSIKGDPGSRYYSMVKRRTRCVTIYYEDGMHLDITPAVLQPDREDRTSTIFHDDPDEPAEPSSSLLMNAWGFSTLFKSRTSDTTHFAEAYARSSWAADDTARAESEEVDPQEDPAHKSSDVVALQLLKRFRNTRYANRNGRMPPSILLSKYVSDAANPMEPLVNAFEHHARHVLAVLSAAERSGRLVYEENPTCAEDCFTDRWPTDRSAQRLFISDMRELLACLESLKNNDLTIREIQELLTTVFGEFPVKAAVRSSQAHLGTATRMANVNHKLGGGITIGCSAANARGAPVSTNMGGELRG